MCVPICCRLEEWSNNNFIIQVLLFLDASAICHINRIEKKKLEKWLLMLEYNYKHRKLTIKNL